MKPLSDLADDEFDRLLHRAVALPDAPPALVHAAIGLFAASPLARPAPGLQALAQAALRQVAAVLSFDSWAVAPQASGLRTLRAETRHLLFSAEGRDVDLRIAPAADGFMLTGQVLGPDETGRVELAPLGADGAAAKGGSSAALDALGEFRLEGVGAGRYRLRLHVGDDAIELPPIEVGVHQP